MRRLLFLLLLGIICHTNTFAQTATSGEVEIMLISGCRVSFGGADSVKELRNGDQITLHSLQSNKASGLDELVISTDSSSSANNEWKIEFEALNDFSIESTDDKGRKVIKVFKKGELYTLSSREYNDNNIWWLKINKTSYKSAGAFANRLPFHETGHRRFRYFMDINDRVEIPVEVSSAVEQAYVFRSGDGMMFIARNADDSTVVVDKTMLEGVTFSADGSARFSVYYRSTDSAGHVYSSFVTDSLFIYK